MQVESLHQCIGVELNINHDHVYSCRFCLLSKKDQTLTIERKKITEGTLNTIIEALPRNYPVALTLTGKGIIHKNLNAEANLTSAQIFQNAFPAIDQKDFYIQNYFEKGCGLVSIIRKTQVDDLLEKLKRAGLKIYSLSLGAIGTNLIWPQLNIYANEIQFDGHQFNLNEQKQFLTYQYKAEFNSKFPVKIEQEVIDERNVLAYASAFQLLLHEKITPVIADVDAVNNDFSNFLAHAKLKKNALRFLFALFALLLISFVLFSYYNQENAKLAQQVVLQTANADQTDLMNKNIAENEALLKQLNWNGGYNYGFIITEIGKTTPKHLQLKEITVNEFKAEIEKAERIPSIKIVGTTSNLTAVNNWIFVLKEKSWVKTVKLLKYQEDSETEEYEFSLFLTY